MTAGFAGALLVVLVALRPAAAAPTPPPIAPEQLTDEHISLAIEALVDELYGRKQPNRFWDPATWTYRDHGSESQVGGYTALAVLALLYAGEPYQDPRLRDAIEHLKQTSLQGTYAVALRAHVWSLLPSSFSAQLEADARWLLGGFSERVAGWDYEFNPRTLRQDHSLRQYGALGLWEAAKRGIPVHDRYWQMLEQAFVTTQLLDGGWNYKADDEPPRGSMTAAGLTMLFITQDFLHAAGDVEIGRRHTTPSAEAIARGLQWMEENFAPDYNPGRRTDYFYYLYGVERVGLASGYRFFGEHDWFREGAAEVIRQLCAWDPEARTMSVHANLEGDGRRRAVEVRHIAFSLMFLSRGRNPVAVNKLQVADLAWNNRPRDVANLVDRLRERTESQVNWQIVDFAAEPEQWLDAPVLYLASHEQVPWTAALENELREHRRALREHERRDAGAADTAPPPPPSSPQIEKLRRYLDLGGLLLAVNEGSARRFGESIEALGTSMYPDLAWRTLEQDHWAYTLHQPVGAPRPLLRGLSNGVRELIIVSPAADMARTFQARDQRRQSEFDAAANIYFYASEMGRCRPRLGVHTVTPPEKAPSRRVRIAQASHAGTWRPEPLAWEVLGRVLARRHDVGLDVQTMPLEAIATADPAPPLVIVNGVAAHEFTAAEREAIRAYAESGGVILFETPGGLGEFTASAEAMATELFGRAPQSINRSAIVTGEGIDGGARLARVAYRPFALQHFGGIETAPRLLGIELDGAPRVLFSREDISFGLLDQPRWGVAGYAPESARELAMNIVLWAGK